MASAATGGNAGTPAMASAATDRNPGTPAMARAATDGVKKWTWLVENDTYLLKLTLLAGLTPADLSVRVDGKRRLTITDRRKPPPSGKAPRLNRTFRFQLPKTANPDAVKGCFNGNGAVLTLTVPFVRKGPQQPGASGAAAAAKEEEQKAKAELERKPIDTAVATKKEEEEHKAKAEAEPEREKELIRTAVAAFAVGVVFSHRLFSRRN